MTNNSSGYSNSSLPYDDSDIESVEEYAASAVESTLRKLTSSNNLPSAIQKRGSFGTALETFYFKIPQNSSAQVDFPKIGLELKSTPMQLRKGQFVAKERLVISMINFHSIVDENWDEASLLKKLRKVLIMSYLYEAGVNPVDYRILSSMIWSPPKEDMDQFRRDWEKIREMVIAGKAHLISSSDTLYLEACTKAANSKVQRTQPFSSDLAKPRAWALKRAYVNSILGGVVNSQAIVRTPSESNIDLLELVQRRLSVMNGKTLEEMGVSMGYERGKLPKNIAHLIIKRLLGVEKGREIEEFHKAGIVPKVIRLKWNGSPKEAMSFAGFSYDDLVKEEFEESRFYQQLQTKYLFVIFREDSKSSDQYRYDSVHFWQMPESDLPEAKRCYDLMQLRTLEGRAKDSVLSTENRCCHVRPKARTGSDTVITPSGERVVKKSFWLNASYIKTFTDSFS